MNPFMAGAIFCFKQQANLKNDVEVLDDIIKDPKLRQHKTMSVAFHFNKFDDVSWKTAQSTGALSYMSYDTAEKYAGIYSLQEEVEKAQLQGTRDAITSIGPILNVPDNTNPNPSEAQFMKEHLEVVQGQLILIESLVKGLDAEYKKFLAARPA